MVISITLYLRYAHWIDTKISFFKYVQILLFMYQRARLGVSPACILTFCVLITVSCSAFNPFVTFVWSQEKGSGPSLPFPQTLMADVRSSHDLHNDWHNQIMFYVVTSLIGNLSIGQ